jgi:hypothetical protein
MRVCSIALLAVVTISVLAGCTSTPTLASGDAPPVKLGDIVTTGKTGAAPASGYYYMAVAAQPDAGATLPPNTCVDRSFWAFARRFLVGTTSAAAVLTVTVTPSTQPSEAITVPVFTTSASEIDSSGKGANCRTEFVARPLTFTFNSNLNPTFKVDMAFHLSNNASATAVTNLLTSTSSLMKLMGSASATPAALVTTLADPAIRSMAASIDSTLSNEWTNSNDLKFSTDLNPGANGGAVLDKIAFRMPALNPGAGGVTVGTWDAGGVLSLVYGSERFKSSGQWIDRDSVMSSVIVPSKIPTAQTTLYKIVLNGDAAGGFKLAGLNTASTTDALGNACNDLRLFLSSFLIPDDALVARFAVLKGSPYEKQPQLRTGSNCFSDTDISNLASFRPDFRFSSQNRQDYSPRDLDKLMRPITARLLTQNQAAIRSVVTTPVTNFQAVLSKDAADFLQGDAAIARLVAARVQLTCYQARPSSDLSSVAALAVYDGTTTGAVVSFDGSAKLTSLILMSPDDVASSTGVDKSLWLNSRTGGCAVTS